MGERENLIVRDVLRMYDVTDPELRFIQHNENITYRVTEKGRSYVLRVHAPVEGFSLGLFEDASPVALMKGETELLLHLSKTASFPVQTPIANKNGEYVTVLPSGIPAELLEWIDGEPLDDEIIKQYAGEIAALAARLHAALVGFDGRRPSYSHDFVRRMADELQIAGEKHHLTKDHVSIFTDVLAEVDRIMAALDMEPNTKSLIHSDLGSGNILKTPTGLAFIDFSLSGYGYKAQECGMIASNYSGEDEWERVREGYEKAGGVPIEKYHMEAFRAFSVLGFIASQHDRYWREERFKSSLTRWTNTIFLKVLSK